jgi:hypothetical protein
MVTEQRIAPRLLEEDHPALVIGEREFRDEEERLVVAYLLIIAVALRLGSEALLASLK